MLLLAWIVRIVLLLFVARLVMRLLAGVAEGLRGVGPAGTGGGRVGRRDAAVPLVKDPVCGTYVVRSKALNSVAGGETHYFCSETCRRTFETGRASSRSA